MMMAAFMGGGRVPDETLRTWFDRTVAAQFDYNPAYGEMLWYLRPRWGGSHEAMLAFGRACLETKRFDTVVPSTFIRAVDDVSSEVDDWRTTYQEASVAADVLACSRGMVDEPTRRAEQPLRLSYLAINAWMCGRADEAGKALAALAGKGGFRSAAAEKLGRFNLDQKAFFSEVALLNGPARDDYQIAEAMDEAADVDKAIEAYQLVVKEAGAAEPAGAICRAGGCARWRSRSSWPAANG